MTCNCSHSPVNTGISAHPVGGKGDSLVKHPHDVRVSPRRKSVAKTGRSREDWNIRRQRSPASDALVRTRTTIVTGSSRSSLREPSVRPAPLRVALPRQRRIWCRRDCNRLSFCHRFVALPVILDLRKRTTYAWIYCSTEVSLGLPSFHDEVGKICLEQDCVGFVRNSLAITRAVRVYFRADFARKSNSSSSYSQPFLISARIVGLVRRG